MSSAKAFGNFYRDSDEDSREYIKELALRLPFVARLEIIFKLDINHPLRNYVIENLSDNERAIMNKGINAIEKIMKKSEVSPED